MLELVVLRALVGRIPLVARLISIVFILATTIGLIIHFIEPDVFPTWFDAVWWALVTVSTVGYGDFVPVTTIGRVLGIILIFSGVGFMTLFVTSLAAKTISTVNAFREGMLTFMGDGHVIIIGWNERSRHAIENLQKVKPKSSIVLIDDTLQELPQGLRHIHFVRGNSSEDATLKQANIGLASSVLITAQHQGSEFSSDAHSILSTLAVKSQHPEVYTIVEVLTTEQIANAKRAGADEIVESTTLTGSVLINSLLYHHMSDVLDDLLTFNERTQLTFSPIVEEHVKKTFAALLIELYNGGDLLIGVKRSEEVLLHPPHDTVIQQGDLLILINRLHASTIK
ncbi:potassium channel family protein [Alkalihalophilus pseudofirmus]|uniref:Potassium channel family protein n=1 Tax=Alkalihalophilus pseudofirmus TaxID=79885 RepID=A0AAJ2NPD1_ALKPS|nr:potassium channel family protein [Alkalihalophilus pseudofirmus]MDV2886086.1 potassium channel family protein [Alkalihalophilus pseudofirmus]WEG16379.1 potassium channel family protein [Alkalihalophilus pseudofirmus]